MAERRDDESAQARPVHAEGAPLDTPADVAADAAEALLDADFGGRLDNWGSIHRMGMAAVGVLLVTLLLPDAPWVLWLLSAYFASSGLAFWLVNNRRTERFKALGRTWLLLVDVITVSALSYGWGTHTSPASFMYLPIVVGFTLVPQRHLGRVALLLVLAVNALLLLLEHFLIIPYAPFPLRGASDAMHGRLFFFAVFAIALTAVQAVVEFTVLRVREHRLVVVRLIAERERRAREIELAGQLEEAARLEALGRLSGGVAHDFNNLLMALLGHAELARPRVRTDPAFVERALADIERAAEHGRELTAQLLDFASRRPERPRTLELNQAVSEAGKLLARLLRQAVQLELSLSNEPFHVRLDPGSLERALFNLAVNASDAMPSGGKLTVSVARDPARPQSHARICVSDQGTGIPEEDLPRIFEPFFTRKERGKGTGLGLASVYGIVRQSHGEIDVHSKLGEGTRFELSFPLTTPDEESASKRAVAHLDGGHRVLLVDDHDDVREVVRTQLQDAGYRVLAVSSPELALRQLEQSDQVFDVLVSDVVMPQMSGVELATKARALRPTLALVLISGFADTLSPDKLSALQAALLHKPFSAQHLLQTLRQSLEQRVN